ncbi:MAG: ABC transporter permease [Oscillatoriales cyanobacterium SM2_2_1]|nr:ABC transporter permease [Oscillatoriales cyanobacterium SM2_2_1]
MTLTRRFWWIGVGISAFFAVLAITTPFLQTLGLLRDPSLFLDFPIHVPPSAEFWFGTDQQGHDVLARVVGGVGVAWQVMLLAMALSAGIGVPLGLISGYGGGWLDRGLVLVMDALYTLPGLLLAITITFIVGPGVVNAAIALSVSYVPQYFRLVRNQVMALKNTPLIEAARAVGASPWRIVGRYLAPTVLRSIPAILTLNAADAILTLAGLGFLGLGVPERVPEWGHDLKQALDAFGSGEAIWWTTLFPGATMTLMVTGLSLMGEGLNRE